MSLENNSNLSHKETLSALLDNEADDLELRRVLKELAAEPSLAETWRRYNVTRSLMHNDEMVQVSPAATQRIFAAIDAEPIYLAADTARGKTATRAPWMGSVGRVAIAASVALAAFLGLQSTLFDAPAGMPVATGTDATQTPALAAEQSRDGVDAEAQARLNEYIRSVSIENREENNIPQFNILQDSQLIRQVNQIDPIDQTR